VAHTTDHGAFRPNVCANLSADLYGIGAAGIASQGTSVALSADSTAVAGALADNRVTGAAWVHTRSGGVWTPIAAPSPRVLSIIPAASPQWGRGTPEAKKTEAGGKHRRQ
jgi:hypothetical protein